MDLLPDLFDQYPSDLKLMSKQWMHFGAIPVFSGQALTVRCFEDNSRVKELLATPGNGRVLVVDGQGSISRALIGDMIAQSAIDNAWAGVIINGAIRDVFTLSQMDIGIKSVGVCPIRSQRQGKGEVDCEIVIGGATIASGDYIYADLNGVAVSKQMLKLE